MKNLKNIINFENQAFSCGLSAYDNKGNFSSKELEENYDTFEGDKYGCHLGWDDEPSEEGWGIYIHSSGAIRVFPNKGCTPVYVATFVELAEVCGKQIM